MKKAVHTIKVVGARTNFCPAGGIAMPFYQTWSVLFATASAAIESFRRQIRI
jgi:hypothetical protein